MESKDATIIKVLSDLDLRSEPELSPEQEQMLKRALTPDASFLDAVEQLFSSSSITHKNIK